MPAKPTAEQLAQLSRAILDAYNHGELTRLFLQEIQALLVEE